MMIMTVTHKGNPLQVELMLTSILLLNIICVEKAIYTDLRDLGPNLQETPLSLEEETSDH